MQRGVLCHCLLPLGGQGGNTGQEVGLGCQQGLHLRLELRLGGCQALDLCDKGKKRNKGV